MLASDGDLQEGLSGEASSIAGTQALGNLTVIWDDNHISIEGDTTVAFTEDVVQRYRAYGWHTETVRMKRNGAVDVKALDAALQRTRKITDRPVFIALQSVIGWPAPNKKNTGEAHGAKLGAAEVAEVKKILGFDPDRTFQIEPEVLAHTRMVAERGRLLQQQWDARFVQWKAQNPQRRRPAAPPARPRAARPGRGPADVREGPVHRHPHRLRQGDQRPRPG